MVQNNETLHLFPALLLIVEQLHSSKNSPENPPSPPKAIPTSCLAPFKTSYLPLPPSQVLQRCFVLPAVSGPPSGLVPKNEKQIDKGSQTARVCSQTLVLTLELNTLCSSSLNEIQPNSSGLSGAGPQDPSLGQHTCSS